MKTLMLSILLLAGFALAQQQDMQQLYQQLDEMCHYICIAEDERDHHEQIDSLHHLIEEQYGELTDYPAEQQLHIEDRIINHLDSCTSDLALQYMLATRLSYAEKTRAIRQLDTTRLVSEIQAGVDLICECTKQEGHRPSIKVCQNAIIYQRYIRATYGPAADLDEAIQHRILQASKDAIARCDSQEAEDFLKQLNGRN